MTIDTSIFPTCAAIAAHLNAQHVHARLAVFVYGACLRAVPADDAREINWMHAAHYPLIGVYTHGVTAEQIADDVEAVR